MTKEMQATIERLRSLPETDQARVAPQINDYLTRLEHLRAMVREGLDDSARGDVVPFDAEDVIRRGAARRAAREADG